MSETPKKHILYLTNEGTLQECNDFLTVLSEPLVLEGPWSCSILQFKCPRPKAEDKAFHICSSIVRYSAVGESRLRTLMNVYPVGNKRKSVAQDLIQGISVPLGQERISHLRMYITDNTGEILPLQAGNCYYTVSLERRDSFW